jgi:histidinol-phosphate aminotransferase
LPPRKQVTHNPRGFGRAAPLNNRSIKEMPQTLNSAAIVPSFAKDALHRGFSRRQLGRIAALVSGAAAMPFYNEYAFAQRAPGMRRAFDPDAVRISSNENPLGPCAEACEAIAGIAKFGGRYSPHNEQGDFIQAVAGMEGLKPDYITAYAGSSDPLHRTVCAFTSPTRSLVMGDPGYEAPARSAQFIGAKVYNVPLTKDYRHDVKAMLAADPNAGLYYICNPNNPTGTLTPREDIEYLLANKPKGSVLLLDEAYVHFAEVEPMSSLVADGKDVVILRTFSKAYGMAGIRAGQAMARPDLLAKLRPYGAGMLPITGLVAATTSMKTKDLIPQRRKINGGVRADVFEFMDAKKIEYIKSQSNCFMMQCNRPGGEIATAMAKQKVYIGRVWKSMPTYVRVTVGTQAEMDKFKAALITAMA